MAAGFVLAATLTGCAAQPPADLAACETAYEELARAMNAFDSVQYTSTPDAARVHLDEMMAASEALDDVAVGSGTLLEDVTTTLERIVLTSKATLSGNDQADQIDVHSAELVYKMYDLEDFCVEQGAGKFVW